ncbi:MAG: diaminopimelate epimerase [Xanthomonadales bacterium]|nr:diaminopimelate epimerase [Xanthomonadales bacterium]
MATPQTESLGFHKLEALGNDFMLIDARQRSLAFSDKQVRHWANRRRGVGFDQLLILRPAPEPGQHCLVEIRNADGSEAEQCGNGMRAVALWLARHDGTSGATRLATAAGSVEIEYRTDDDISATLGAPDFTPASVGLAGFQRFPAAIEAEGEQLEVYGASLGNPHLLVVEERSPDAARLEKLGRALGQHPDLARGANVGLATIESRHRVDLKVFERGAGATRACGSGAAAAAAILLHLGRVDNPVEVAQPGGTLVVNWRDPGQAIAITGPAREVFEGVIPCPTQDR